MDKQNVTFIGIVVIIVIFAFGLFYMNGMMFPDSKQTGQADAANLSFKVETAEDNAYLTFRYIPAGIISGPVTATYQAQKDSQVLFNDQKTFASVSPDNPIEIAMKMSDSGNYTMIMLISDKGKNLVHQSSTTYFGSNATSSTTQATI